MKIGRQTIGHDQPCYVIAEIGINHNGCLDTALRMISEAAFCGVQAVKFQKRTIDVVYTPEELSRPRESIYGATNGDLKRGLEFDDARHWHAIAACANEHGLDWFVSCWDVGSVDFIEPFQPAAHKIASACLTDDRLLRRIHATGRPVILSTGMSTTAEVDFAVAGELGRNNLAILQCTANYPAEDDTLNLRAIRWLAERYRVPVGYSGHERGIATTVAAVALGACIVERHFTLDRSMWGSDQAASLEPKGLERLVRDIRAVEAAMGNPGKDLLECEIPALRKLRRYPTCR